MGIYLNPGNDNFTEAVHSKIYVDKSGLIEHTNELLYTMDKYLCVSRPRRFGKSTALHILAAYYSRGCDSRKLFEGLAIENASTFEEHLNQYDVILLNMQQFLNDEKSLSCAIGLAYYSARKDYKIIRKMPAGHGFADIVLLPIFHMNTSTFPDDIVLFFPHINRIKFNYIGIK